MTRKWRAAILPGLLLAASGCTDGENTSDSDASQVCLGMLSGDPEIVSDLAGFSSDVAAYCSCYEAALSPLPESERTVILTVSQAIAAVREEQNVGLETAADLIEDDADKDPPGATYGVTGKQFRDAGQFIERVRRDLRDNDGQCPVSDLD